MARAFNEIAKPNDSFIHLREFPGLRPDSTDLEWISKLAEEGDWVILTKDKNIMKKPAEKAAFQTANLTGFFLDKTWQSMDLWAMFSKLASLMPQILRLAVESPRGACFKVPIRAKDIQRL